MKLLFIFSAFLFISTANNLANSVWVYNVSNTCSDKLKFRSNTKVDNYDCELNYTFHDNYLISKDTLVISEKDNSHSEDGGKIESYRLRFLIRNKVLYLINVQRLTNGKWESIKSVTDIKYSYQKSSN